MSPSIRHTFIAYSTQPPKIFIAFRCTLSPSFKFTSYLLFSFLFFCFSFFLFSFSSPLFSFYLFSSSSLLCSALIVTSLHYSSLLLSLISIFVFLSLFLFFVLPFSVTHPTNSFSTSTFLFYSIYYSFSHLVTLKLRTIINT